MSIFIGDFLKIKFTIKFLQRLKSIFAEKIALVLRLKIKKWGRIAGTNKNEEVMKMIEQDTIRLLRECDAGVRMGIASLEDVLKHAKGEDMKKILCDCKEAHEALGEDLEKQLHRFEDEGKAPNPIAKGMSWMKTELKLAMCEKDATIADLMVDGANMGVKSLSRYLNEYKAADEEAKGIAKRLIALEDALANDLRAYL